MDEDFEKMAEKQQGELEREERKKERQRLRLEKRQRLIEMVAARKKAEKEALKEKEKQKRAKQKEKERAKLQAKKLAKLKREKEQHEKEKQAKSARLKYKHDQRRNAYKRKKRAIATRQRLKIMERVFKEKTYLFGLQIFLEEMKWLRFCAKTPEEREQALANARKYHHALPREYTPKWAKEIERRIFLRKKQLRRVYLRLDIKKRTKILKLRYAAKAKAERDAERLRREKTITHNYFVTRTRVMTLAERVIKGDEIGNYAIYAFNGNNSKRRLSTSEWREDIFKIYENYISKKVGNTIIPDLRSNHTHQVYLVRDAKPNEDPTIFVRDDDGRFVKDSHFENENVVILRKNTWYDEELFYVYGYHPTNDKKDFNFIYKQILLKGNTKDHYSTKQVMVHKNKVLIISDNDFDIIMARDNNTANTLYEALQEKYTNIRGEKVFFFGTMREVTWERFLPEMQKKTGWSEEDCINCSSESF